jgi:hypothetical protein
MSTIVYHPNSSNPQSKHTTQKVKAKTVGDPGISKEGKGQNSGGSKNFKRRGEAYIKCPATLGVKF